MLCLIDLVGKDKLGEAMGEETMKQFDYALQMQAVGEEVCE